ncbi:MAG TPA: threonine dehydratase [Rhodopila sp.]|uniref:threonine dehydratase n=1 Tax=Rhodopila sp. TaxID=2480087 RepID=UPI002B6F0A78|nr:threonine dehydratase [Rhodopila sp.]HVY15535.1 threonine dehydratase [Rhodopila sp.]
MFSLHDLEDAAILVHAHLGPSPALAWPLLARRTGAEVFVKHENHLPTGAFKVRGGVVYADRLTRDGTAGRGLISATRGNHGQSLAWAGQRFGIPVTIVVPFGNSTEKNAAMTAFGARLIEHGADFEEAREEADRLAAAEGLTFVPSFAPPLMRGVATYALELFRTVPDLDAVYVPIGLGSGICGTILARDLLGLKTRVIGVQSTGADAYARSFAARTVVPGNRAETRADGIAVRQPDPDALRIILAGCERIATVPDDAIAAAIRAYWTDTHNLIEGAGAAPLAALIAEREQMRGKRVALIASGGNLDMTLFRMWVAQEVAEGVAQGAAEGVTKGGTKGGTG